MLVHRSEVAQLSNLGGWLLVFGRRKVGKTFLLNNFLDHDRFFLVKRGGSILMEGETSREYNDLSSFIKDLKKMLMDGETIVIDEFQRLSMNLWDEIALSHPYGNLILSGSSLKIVDKVLSNRSPLLGLLYPVRIPLIGPIDIINGLSEHMDPVETISLSPYMMDPWTIPLLEKCKDLSLIIPTLKYVVPGLVGEVFSEEERELTRTYESIISLVGSGMDDYNRIAKILYDRGIITQPYSPSILPYLSNLKKMGLLKKYKKYKSRKSVYRLTSHVMKLYYYLESSYNLEDREIQHGEIKPTIDKLNQLAVEEFLCEFIAEIVEGRVELVKEPDREIDIFITKRNKPFLVGEVKWGKSNGKDLEVFKDKVSDLYCNKIFISKEKLDIEDDEVKILGAGDILKIAKKGSLNILK